VTGGRAYVSGAGRDAAARGGVWPRLACSATRPLPGLLEPFAAFLARGARRLPAANDLAERGRRPPVRARTVSCGAPSDAGARPRGRRLSVLQPLKTRQVDGLSHRHRVLAPRAQEPPQAPWPLLCPKAPTRH
jgi:hypothetical protein